MVTAPPGTEGTDQFPVPSKYSVTGGTPVILSVRAGVVVAVAVVAVRPAIVDAKLTLVTVPVPGPVFVIVTAPVGELTAIPAPAIILVTPVPGAAIHASPDPVELNTSPAAPKEAPSVS